MQDVIFGVTAVDKTAAVLDKIAKRLDKLPTDIAAVNKKATQSTDKATTEMGGMWEQYGKKLLTAAIAAKVAKEAFDFTKESVILASRVETLGLVTETLGRNAGYTADEIHELEKAIQAQGITTQVSRQAIATMIQGEIDLAHATDLARLAQDAAVIGNTNSSEALERLSLVIATGNTLMARRMGLMVDFQGAYAKEAEAMGKSSVTLTEQEKVLIRTNEVLAQGTNIVGAYAASQETAGGAAKSFARHLEEMKVAFGAMFQDEYKAGITTATGFVDMLGEMYDAQGALSKAHNEGKISASEYHLWMNKLRISFWDASHVAGLLADRQSELDAITERSASTYRAYLIQQLEITQATGLHNDATAALAQAIADGTAVSQGYLFELGLITEATWRYGGAAESADSVMLKYAATMELITDGTRIAASNTRDYASRVQALTAANKASAAAAEEAQTAHEAMLNAIDRDIGSPITSFIEDMEWFIATGGQFEAAIADIKEGVKTGIMTPEVGMSLAESLIVPFEAAAIAMGDTDFSSAAESVASALDVPLEVAEEMLTAIGGMPAALDAVSATEIRIESLEFAALTAEGYLHSLQAASGRAWEVSVNTTYTSSGAAGGAPGSSARPPGGGYTPPSPPERPDYGGAMGADFTVPPGYPNDSFTMGLTSGEDVLVVPPGKKTSRGTTSTYNDYSITNVNNPLAAAMLLAQKQAVREMRFDMQM